MGTCTVPRVHLDGVEWDLTFLCHGPFEDINSAWSCSVNLDRRPLVPVLYVGQGFVPGDDLGVVESPVRVQ